MRDWGTILVSTRLEKHVTSRFFQAWTSLIKEGLRPDDGVLSVSGKVAHKAQNDVVRHLLSGSWDTLLTLDSDADIPPDFLERFRTYEPGYEYDALQAFYVRRGWPPRAIWLKRNGDGDIMDYFIRDPDMIDDVDIVGTHACLIRRDVFETLLGNNDPETHEWFFYPRHQTDSEDGAFSREAKAAGFRLGATTAIRAGHIFEETADWETYQDYLNVSGRAILLDRYTELAHMIAEFTGETVEQVVVRAGRGNANVSDAWYIYNPKSAEEERKFYGYEDNGYLYDLLAWNCSSLYEQIVSPLREVQGERVLVVGAGLGTEADLLADRNSVCIFELPGALRDFCMWRLGDRSSMILGDELPSPDSADPNTYDRIVAIDVLEHVHPDEILFVLTRLKHLLRPEGIFYLHNNWGDQDKYPMHHDHSDIFAAWCQQYGIERIGAYEWQLPCKSNITTVVANGAMQPVNA